MRRTYHPVILFLCFLAVAAGTASCAKPVVVETCYTPDPRCSGAVVAEIGAARSEVLVQAHALTDRPVMDALVRARDAGMNVSVILDRTGPSAETSALYLAAQKGVPVFIDGRHAAAGSNVVIVDKATVITGSMAFTADAAEKNAENLVIIRSEGTAGAYLANWGSHKEHSEEFVKIAEPQKTDEPQQPAKAEKKKPAKTTKKKKKTT